MSRAKKPSAHVVALPQPPRPTPPAFLTKRAPPPVTAPDPGPPPMEVAPEPPPASRRKARRAVAPVAPLLDPELADEEEVRPAQRRRPLKERQSQFYRNCRVHLNRLGMTENAVCLRVGISRDYLRNYREDRAKIPLAKFATKLAEFFGTTTDELLYGDFEVRAPGMATVDEHDPAGYPQGTWRIPAYAVPKSAEDGQLFLLQATGAVPEGLAAGDILLVDGSQRRATQTGLYVLEISDEQAPVHIKPKLSARGVVSVSMSAGTEREDVETKDLTVVGRVVARWSKT